MASATSYRSLEPPNDDGAERNSDCDVWSSTEPNPTKLVRMRVVQRSEATKKSGARLFHRRQNFDGTTSEKDHAFNPKQSTAQRATRWAVLTTDTWFMEVLAALISFAAFASIIGVVWYYDNKPVPSLLRGITLNAVIAFLATTSRTSIMLCIGTALSQGKWLWFKQEHSLTDLQSIENASRGPLGSVLLLFKLKGGLIIWLAAFLTVITLGFDPFVQQLLTFQTRVIPENKVGITINAARQLLDYSPVMTYPETGAQIAAAMLEAVQQFQSSAPLSASQKHRKRSDGTSQALSSPLQPVCPSGNCVWAPYYALDICTQCRNTTQELSVTTNSTYATNAMSYASAQASRGTSDKATLQLLWDVVPKNGLGFQMQNNVSATTLNPDLMSGTADIVRKIVWPLNFGVVTDALLQGWTPGTFAGVQNPVTAFGFAEFGVSNEGTPWLNKSLECALTYCVKQFNRSVIQNTLVSNILSEHYGTFMFLPNYLYNWSATVDDTLYTVSNAGIEYPQGIETLSDYLLGQSIHTYFQQIQGAIGPILVTSNYTDEPSQIVAPEEYSWKGIDLTEDFTTVLDNTLSIVSDVLQEYGNSTIYGSNAVTKTFVVVRWPWIALPGLSILLGLIVFITIVFETRRLRAPKWSSSLLPLIYRHIDVEEKEDDQRRGPTHTVADPGLDRCPDERYDGSFSLHGSNLVSRFELEAAATNLLFEQNKDLAHHRMWTLRSVEFVHKGSEKDDESQSLNQQTQQRRIHDDQSPEGNALHNE